MFGRGCRSRVESLLERGDLLARGRSGSVGIDLQGPFELHPRLPIVSTDRKPIATGDVDPAVVGVECRQPLEVTADELRDSGLDPGLAEAHEFFAGLGCIECGGTGYRGRTALCELLDLTDDLREMILARAPTSEIKQAMRDKDMRFLRDSAVEKVLSGLTTLREINKVTFVE